MITGRSLTVAAATRAGFALPSVLFVVAMVTLVFLVAIEALASLNDETRRVEAHIAFQAAALTIEADAAFQAATLPVGPAAILDGPAGQPSLSLDGRLYATPPLLVSLQDEAGLINLDNLPASTRQRLFAQMGVAPAMVPTMADRLGDFLDPGAMKRPLGADAADYLRAGLAPPPKGPLQRRAQVLGLLGWDEAVGEARWRVFRDAVTADPSSIAVNLNTATASMLEVVYGLTADQAARALAARQQRPFTQPQDLGRLFGLSMPSDAERVYSRPDGRFALKIEDRGTGLVYRSRIVLSLADADRPIWVLDPTIAALDPAEKAQESDNALAFPDPAR